MIENLQDAPLIPPQTVLWTAKDPVLSRVVYPRGVATAASSQQGLENKLKLFWQCHTALSTPESVSCGRGRVVVPERSREYIITEIHGGHPRKRRHWPMGIVWWPVLDG